MQASDPQIILRGKFGANLDQFANAPAVALLAVGMVPTPAAPTIASAATIAPQTDIFFISGTTTIDTITVPPGLSAGGHILHAIPTGIFAISTTGNVGLGVTAAVGKVITLTYDPATLKYYPNTQGGAGAGTGDALTANTLAQFAATTSAQLAGVLSDETGSGGGFVRATAPTISDVVLADGLTASGTDPNTFVGSSGAFITSTGANTLSGAVSINDASTPSLTTATGKTNTGFVTILGKTSGGFKITTADATAQTVTLTVAAQTSGAGAIGVPDIAGVAQDLVLTAKAATLTNKTITAPTITAFTATGTSTIGNGLTVTTPVIASGLTASGSGANSFAGSSGTFLTSTGVNTFGGSSHLFAAKATPSTDDGAALGDTTHNWSDLFLATGAVLNFQNGNVAVTHSSGILTMGTGELRVTTPGTNAASVPTLGSTSTLTAKTLTAPVLNTGTVGTSLVPTTDDGAPLGDTTHHFSDLFLATGAVINFQNGNAAVTHSSGILTVSTGDLRVTTAGTNAASAVTVGGTQTLSAKTFVAPALGAATGTSLVLTGGVRATPTVYTADGAITLASGIHLVEKTSAAAMTVAAPSSQDGERMTIISNTDFAHIITFTGATLLDGTTGANLTVTMTAFKGSALVVVARGTKWLLESSSNLTSITI